MDEPKGFTITEEAMFEKIGRLVMINEELARRLVEIEQAQMIEAQSKKTLPKDRK